MKICKKTAFFFFPYKYFSFYAGEKKQAAEQSLQAFGFLYILCKEKADAQEPQQNGWRWEFKAGSRMGKIFLQCMLPSHFAQCNSLQCFLYIFLLLFFPLSELCLSLLLAPLITIMSPRPSPATSHACWAASLLLRAANNAFLILACVSTLEAGNWMDWSPSLWDWTTERLSCRGPRGWPCCTLNLMETGACSELGFSEAQRAVCCSVLVYF